MRLKHYPITARDDFSFTFKSLGPKGEVIKIVVFSPQFSSGRTVFNLAFGDKLQLDDFDDTAVTNNNDRDLVLSTVAFTVLKFIEDDPERGVRARGSTPARTRLYQMSIAKNLTEIEENLNIMGKHLGKWVCFQRGINFTEFLVEQRKIK